MWNSWLPTGIFPTRRAKNSNLQKRIISLFESSKTSARDASPVLQSLKNHKNRVRRLSSVYEENIAAFNETTNNSFLVPKSSFSCTSLPNDLHLSARLDDIAESPTPFNSPKASFTVFRESIRMKENLSQIANHIKKLVEWDQDYIVTMKLLIERYVEEIDRIPALRMKGETSISNRQKQEIFGQIELISDLHEYNFHPALVACESDVLKFAETISKMCNECLLSAYLVHAMDEKVSFAALGFSSSLILLFHAGMCLPS